MQYMAFRLTELFSRIDDMPVRRHGMCESD